MSAVTYPLTGPADSASGPTPRFMGDLWFCTQSGSGFLANTLYEHDGTSWEFVATPGANSFGNWTPVDASGAGLALTASGTYDQVGRLVFYRAIVVYPATASGASAAIGGLPAACANNNQSRGGNLTYANVSGVAYALVGANTAQVQFFSSSGTGIANSVLSGGTVLIEGNYATS